MLHLLTIAYALWVLYLIVMGLYRAKLDGRLSRPALILGAPFLLVGYLVDVLANITVASILFLEIPRETLVTSRLTRHLNYSNGWRFQAARWICEHLLDPFDPTGSHCKRKR